MKRILQVIKHFGVKSGVVVNKYDLNKELTQEIKELAGKYGSEFIGVIPYGKEVTEARDAKTLGSRIYQYGPDRQHQEDSGEDT